jgi:hypothetical protein
MTALEQVLERLGPARRNGTGWMARCQAHDDQQASLSVSEGRDGAVLLHCHAGCSVENVVAASGLTLADLFPPKEPEKTVVATYDYVDHDGRLAYQVVRYQPKTFRQRRPDGTGGWVWHLDGTERVLYRLPHLRAEPDRMVFVVEGEKDADRLADLGLVATTNAGGAGKWRPEYTEELRGRIVTILPDADEPGRQHARDVAQSLIGIASEVRIVELPNLPPKGDVSDWLDEGGTVERLKSMVRGTAPTVELAELVSAAPDVPSGTNRIQYVTAKQFGQQTPEDVPWLNFPFFAFGACHELDGAPKAAGKTTLIAHLIRAAVTGGLFLGQPTHRTPVVLLSEQGPTSLRATLARAGLLDRDNLYIVLWRDVRSTSWMTVVDAAVELCREKGARLLVVDTLPQFAKLAGDSENDSGAALEAMAPCQAAAADGLAVLVSRHDRKGGGIVGESGRGSGAFTGAVDVVLALRRGDGASRPTIRHLHTLSRFEETPDEVVIELTDAGYVVLGSAVNFAVEEAKRAVLAVLVDDATLSVAELVEATGLKRTSIQGAIKALMAVGGFTVEGTGKRNDAKRYSRSPGFMPEPIPDVIGPAETIPDPIEGSVIDVAAEARRIFWTDVQAGASA